MDLAGKESAASCLAFNNNSHKFDAVSPVLITQFEANVFLLSFQLGQAVMDVQVNLSPLSNCVPSLCSGLVFACCLFQLLLKLEMWALHLR